MRSRAMFAFIALLGSGARIAFSQIFVRLADVGPMASACQRASRGFMLAMLVTFTGAALLVGPHCETNEPE